MTTLSTDQDTWSMDIEPFESAGIWFAECPMCMVTVGSDTFEDAVSLANEHIIGSHQEEIEEMCSV